MFYWCNIEIVEIKLIESDISNLVWYTIPYIHNECESWEKNLWAFAFESFWVITWRWSQQGMVFLQLVFFCQLFKFNTDVRRSLISDVISKYSGWGFTSRNFPNVIPLNSSSQSHVTGHFYIFKWIIISQRTWHFTAKGRKKQGEKANPGSVLKNCWCFGSLSVILQLCEGEQNV